MASGDAELSEAVLSGKYDQLPKRSAALARYAATLTAEPWTVTGELAEDLAAAGLRPEEIEAATAVVAMFNYFTRVADASGLEVDYASPLPQFQPQRDRRAVVRPARESWPVVGAEFRTFPRSPALSQAWRLWYEYVFDPRHHVEPRGAADAGAGGRTRVLRSVASRLARGVRAVRPL